jgi:hypothetical protein
MVTKNPETGEYLDTCGQCSADLREDLDLFDSSDDFSDIDFDALDFADSEDFDGRW